MRKMRKSAAVALTAAMAVTNMGVIPAMADETTTIRVMVWDRGDAPQGMTVEENKMPLVCVATLPTVICLV